jgi:hypothetical protein
VVLCGWIKFIEYEIDPKKLVTLYTRAHFGERGFE